MATRRSRANDDSEEMSLRDFLLEIREDPKYKKFRLVVKRAEERLKMEADRNEAFALQAGRTSRTLHARKAYSPKALTDASLKDLSARSRLVEIRVKASFHISLVEEACDALRRYLFTQYKEQFRSYSSEAQRKALVERIQGSAQDILTEGKSLLDMLDHIIKDIDQASFLLKNMMEALKLLDGSKGGRVI